VRFLAVAAVAARDVSRETDRSADVRVRPVQINAAVRSVKIVDVGDNTHTRCEHACRSSGRCDRGHGIEI